MVSVPLVSLTPPPPELIIVLLLGGWALLTVAVLFPPMAMDFFLSAKLHWATSAEAADILRPGIWNLRLLLPDPWSSEGGDVVLLSTDVRLSLLSRSFLLKLHLELELETKPWSTGALAIDLSHSEPSDSSFLALARPRAGKLLQLYEVKRQTNYQFFVLQSFLIIKENTKGYNL